MKAVPLRSDLIQRVDTLLAIKAISLVDGLNANDRRVAAALVEHFRRRDGRCDPGLKRIANLLGISVRTVIRCVHRLVSAGLFQKTRHGGFGNRNSYKPNWGRLAELEEAWRGKFNRKPTATTSDVSPDSGQTCHVPDDAVVTQTYDPNLHHKTYEKRLPKNVNARWRNIAGHTAVTMGTSSSDVVRVEAERRWSSDVYREYGALPVTYSQIVEAVDAAIQTAATDAEIRRRGAGIEYIRHRLKLGGRGDVR